MIIHDVEQRSDEWYALRAGKPTASEFSKLVTSKGEPSKQAKGYAMDLAGEVYAGKRLDAWEGNKWTERGRELEEKAISLYEFAESVTVEPCGFVTNDAATMGCSPDGMVDGDGMVEIKCLKGTTHIDTILYFQNHGHCPPTYVQQTQGQLLVCDKGWCDLVFYHPELPMLTIRQGRDQDVWDGLDKALPALFAERDRVLDAIWKQAGGRPDDQ